MTAPATLDIGELAPAPTPAHRIHFVESLSAIPKDHRGGVCTCWWDRVTEIRGAGANFHRVCVGYQITRISVACSLHGDFRGWMQGLDRRLKDAECCGAELRLVRGTSDWECPVCGQRPDHDYILSGGDPRGLYRPTPWGLVQPAAPGREAPPVARREVFQDGLFPELE